MHFRKRGLAALSCAVSMAAISATQASATEINFMISDVDGKVGTLQEFIDRYKEVAPDVTVNLNQVGYNVIREQLPSQLEAGTGPDMAFVTNLGGLNPYYVDLTPYVDADAWEDAYGAVLAWYRVGDRDGIYAFHTELTVTGPYINRTMFEEAGVEVPAPGATWDDWAEAAAAVQEASGSYAGMVMDRSGHRMAGPAMSYGAAYFDDAGNLIVDDGFKAFAGKMIEWHESGLMPPDIWPAVSGARYANGNELFFNEEVPFYMSGSWNISNVQSNVGDKFDWAVVPVPCGPAGCGVMPGGQGMVAFDQGQTDEVKEAAARFVAWMADEAQAKEWYGKTFAIPAHAKIQAEGVDYTAFGGDPKVSEGLNLFAAGAAAAAEQTPQAYQLQGSRFGFVMYNATVEFLSQVMNGDMSLEEAFMRMEADIADKTAG